MKTKKYFFGGVAIGFVLALALNAGYAFIASVSGTPFSRNLNVFQKINLINSTVEKNFIFDYNKNAAYENMYAAMLDSLGDPYSVYMSAETFTDFYERSEGVYAGVGIMVSIDPSDEKIIVLSVFEKSPAEKSGLLPGDKIIRVEDSDVWAENYDQAVDSIKGRPGSSVNITVFRESENKTFNVDIIRENVDVPTVTHKTINGDIGYIRIYGFDGVAVKQFKESLDALRSENVKSLIVDLRNNPGGQVNVVRDIANMLISAEYIMYTEDKNGKREYVYGNGAKLDIPLYLLVNGNSASASEVLSGAVKDTGQGVIVGEQTFGKGLVQTVFNLPDKSALKLTTAKYYTPNGVCIHGIGITPDYAVELDKNKIYQIPYLTLDEDTQLKKAVELING